MPDESGDVDDTQTVIDVAVVVGGQAALATAYHLRRAARAVAAAPRAGG